MRLVDCEPYNAQLTEASCCERYAQAKGVVPKAPAGNSAVRNHRRRRVLSLCIGCPVGAERTARATLRGEMNSAGKMVAHAGVSE